MADPVLADSRLGNLSTRGFVQTGDDVMIGGLIVEGTEPKTIVVRAIGPSLSAFGITNPLADPWIQIFSGQTLIHTNDNWADHERANDLPAALVPVDAAEAAIVMTLEPGGYTAIVRGNGETTGIALVEVYEVDETSSITNISTRGYVGTGDNVLIGGLIITGDTPKTVVIRGVGPSLEAFGVPGVLQDPDLLLFSGGDVIDANNNWIDHARNADIPSVLVPTDSREAVIVRTLEPGAYTAILQGFGGGVGNGLVEVYELDTFANADDVDGDGIPNDVDNDDDGDGFADVLDAEPLNALVAGDHDGDGADSVTDSDDDNDGVPDATDAAPLDADVSAGTNLCIFDQSTWDTCNLF